MFNALTLSGVAVALTFFPHRLIIPPIRFLYLLYCFSRKSHHEQRKEQEPKRPHIKKPLNAFMLYMKEMRANVVAECTLKESAAINQILGRRVRVLFAITPGGLSQNFSQTQFKNLLTGSVFNALLLFGTGKREWLNMFNGLTKALSL